MLGLDPLYVANEGVAVAVVAPEDADAVLAAARARPARRAAAVVGEVGEPAGRRAPAHRPRHDPPAHHAGRRPAPADLLSAGTLAVRGDPRTVRGARGPGPGRAAGVGPRRHGQRGGPGRGPATSGSAEPLGLYHGVPLADRGTSIRRRPPRHDHALPGDDQAVAGPNEAPAYAVKRTVAHEVAHHFGISDERLLEIDAY